VIIRVSMAEAGVAKHPDIVETQALGSCVGIVLFDPRAHVGGIAHVMLPDISEVKESSHGNLEKYANTAIEILIEKMEDLGAKIKFITAKLAGGANMFPKIFLNKDRFIGKRNTEAARKKLAELGIPIEAEDVGGSIGRTIILDTFAGHLKVRSAMLGEKEI
jgi:chemotaxis protein CheD